MHKTMEKDKELIKIIQDDFNETGAPLNFSDRLMERIDVEKETTSSPIIGKWGWRIVTIAVLGLLSTVVYTFVNSPELNSFKLEMETVNFSQLVTARTIPVVAVFIGSFFILLDMLLRRVKLFKR